MKTITVYNTDEGRILGTYTGSENSIAANVPDGCSFIDGEFTGLFFKVVEGRVVHIEEEVINARELEEAWSDLRGKRNDELAKCDWTQGLDSPLTDIKKQEWATYRQALRDLPSNTVDPSDISWPSLPN